MAANPLITGVVFCAVSPSSEDPEHAGKRLGRRLLKGDELLGSCDVRVNLRRRCMQSVEAPSYFGFKQIVEVYTVVVVGGETFGGADEQVDVIRVLSVGLSERLNLVAQLPKEVVGIRDGDDLASAMIDDSLRDIAKRGGARPNTR